jgi:alkaline phosphatase
MRGTLSLGPYILSIALLTAGGLSPLGAQAMVRETRDDFMARARAQVEANQRLQPNVNKARNVILFVGDGMGATTITAARILDGQQKKSAYGGEENALSFEKFPYLAHSKTYQANQQVPDSAPTMTAIVTGSKANDGMLSIDPRVLSSDDFTAGADPANRLETILEQAEKRGMWTGVVSTARVTHATPGACYAHTPNRGWESDADLSAGAAAAKFKDIARQLLDFSLQETTMNGVRSKGLEVAMGGGRENFLTVNDADPEYPGKKGKRKDGKNLARTWESAGGVYVYDLKGFARIDPATTGPVLGLFEPSHMLYEVDRTKDGTANEPSLAEMTEKAIQILQRGPNGFFLMVEGGRVDHAHHAGNAYRALNEAIELSRAVQKAANLTGDDTLIIVTADHSHTLTMSGYPTRGNDILGLMVTNSADGLPQKDPYPAKDGKPYTTLGYANGPGAATTPRVDLTAVDTKAPDFKQQALVPLESETHGGEDVAIYARGPFAHLFQGTMEENAIYWVMAKALGFW